MSNAEQIPLPEGYNFVDKHEITPDEIMVLRESVGWKPDTPDRWEDCIEQPLGVIVGVRDADDVLVGMGRTTADPRHVVLCDLAVAEGHREQGIGEAILLKRMQIIEERKIPYVYTELAADNSRSKYESIGFVATGRGLFREQYYEEVSV